MSEHENYLTPSDIGSLLYGEYSDETKNPEDIIIERQTRQLVQTAVESSLTPKQKLILDLHLGLSGDPHTFMQIAKILGYKNPGNAHYQEQRALEKLSFKLQWGRGKIY